MASQMEARILGMLSASPRSAASVADRLEISKALATHMLFQLVSEGKVALVEGRGFVLAGHAAGRSTKIREAQRRVARQWQGLSRGRPLSDFPKTKIEKGADVEVEHVGYRPIARRIAADHLMEDRAYYEKLAAMEGRAAGKREKGAPTDLNLFSLHMELQRHLERYGKAEPLFAFQPTSMNAMRRLMKAGFFAPNPLEKGTWLLTGQGRAVYETWREENAGRFGIPAGYKRDDGQAAGRAGRFFYLHACPSSTYEDIQALKETERSITLETFRKAIGLEQWRELNQSLGYDRHLPISRDWHVGFYKGVYRGSPAVFLRHSGIEHIYTLDGTCGPSLAPDRA